MEKKQSWDANDLQLFTAIPETLSDGTPMQAVTVILRTKDAIGGGQWDVLYGYFNDTRDDVDRMKPEFTTG